MAASQGQKWGLTAALWGALGLRTARGVWAGKKEQALEENKGQGGGEVQAQRLPRPER